MHPRRLTFAALCTFALLSVPLPARAQMDSDFSGGGAVRIGDSATTCDAAAEGAIRYNSSDGKTVDYCNGTSWLKVGADALLLNDLSDVNILSAADQEVLTYDSASGTWASAPTSATSINALDDVADVNAPVPTAGQVLKWSGSAWIADTDAGGETLWSDSGAGYIEYGLAGTGIKVEATAAASPTFWGLSDLTDHTANQNIRMSGFWLSNDGGNEGVFVDADGKVGIGTASPEEKLHVAGGQLRLNVNAYIVSGNPSNRIVVEDDSNSAAAANSMTLTAANKIFVGFDATNSGSGQLQIGKGNTDPGGTGWADLVTIDNSGNVGIGTASPQAKLDILNNQGAGGALLRLSADRIWQFEQSGADSLSVLDLRSLTPSKMFRILASDSTSIAEFWASSAAPAVHLVPAGGNVGIGTASPKEKVDIANAFLFRLGSTQLISLRNAEYDDTDGRFEFTGYNGTSYSAQSSFNVNTGDWRFETSTAAGAAGTEADFNWFQLVLDSSGNVGIGTASPDEKLHVDGNLKVSGNGIQSLHGNAPRVVFNETDTSKIWTLGLDSSRIWLREDDTSVTNEKLSIRPGGNVGIGTTNPADPLHVVGDMRFTGTLNAGSVPWARLTGHPTITAGDGLSGGGVLNASRTLSVDGTVVRTSGTQTIAGIKTFSDSPHLSDRFIYFDTNNWNHIQSAAGLVLRTGGGNNRLAITSTGNVGINTISPSTTLDVNGHVNVNNSLTTGGNITGGFNLTVGNNLTVDGAVWALNIYNTTSAAAANVFVNSVGRLLRSTSSARYKKDIENYAKGLDDLLRMRPVTYRALDGKDTVFAGFIAEDVHAIGLQEYVDYDEQGRPDALHYSHITALIVNSIKELKTENDALKSEKDAEIKALRAELDELKAAIAAMQD